MTRGITVALTVIALVLGGLSTSPVHAGDRSRDLAKFLLFSSLLVAIATADHDKPKQPPAARNHNREPRRPHVANTRPKPPPARGYHSRRSACLEDFWNGRKWVTFRDHSCRRFNTGRKGFRAVNSCLRQEFRRGRWVSTFDQHCMRHNGFTIARRW